MQYFRRSILILLLLLLLAGCAQAEPPVPTGPTNPSMPTDDPRTETQLPTPDTVLDVTEISLADFENSLLLFIFGEDKCGIYRICESPENHFIELYETAPISDCAMLDGPISVRSAVQNTTHPYHTIVLENLFYTLHVTEGKTTHADNFAAIRESSTDICFLRTEDMYYAQGEDAQQLYELIQAYYDNRGTGIQIGGAVPSDNP